LLEIDQAQAKDVIALALADGAGEYFGHTQRGTGTADTSDLLDARERLTLVLDAQLASEFLLAGYLEAAELGNAGDEHLGQVVGEIVFHACAQHEHSKLGLACVSAGLRCSAGRGGVGGHPCETRDEDPTHPPGCPYVHSPGVVWVQPPTGH